MFVTEVVAVIAIILGMYVATFFLATFFTHRNKDNPVAPNSWPVVTIAIPFFNEDRDVLIKTVNSVLNLDYPRDKLDILLINDGSTNDTPLTAKKFAKQGVTYISKKNGGKGSCLNLALERSKGEFFCCLDVDSVVDSQALKRMIPYFGEKVMAVTPSLKVNTPKSILERVQVVEFMLGVYLRKVFAYLNAIHVTPGPFSLFRKSFFDKYGKYDEETLTEDIEVALRIQSLGYNIENCITANVYTNGVARFRQLQTQRLRWYRGFLDNIFRYKNLFSWGTNLGMFVLPMSFISVGMIFVVALVSIVEMIDRWIRFMRNLAAVDWDITSLLLWNFDAFFFEFNFINVLSIVVFAISLVTIILAKISSEEDQPLLISYVAFIFLYTYLFAWWWFLAFYYKATKKPIVWGGRTFT